jgi:hypothetical protein
LPTAVMLNDLSLVLSSDGPTFERPYLATPPPLDLVIVFQRLTI